MSKYGNVPTIVDGQRFASKAEAKRYEELKLLLKAGEITDLKLQPRFPLSVNGVNLGTYVGDFIYRDLKRGVVLEDVKGFKTPAYRLKAKLVLAIHGIEITEVAA